MEFRELESLPPCPEHFKKLSPARTILAILADWAMIFGAIGFASRFPSVWTFVLAELVIASRQHALFFILHDGAHFLIVKNRKWNDRLSNALVSWPLFFSTAKYRDYHFRHHRLLNTDEDPDWARRKNDDAWRFPCSKAKYWRNSLPFLIWRGPVDMFNAIRGLGPLKESPVVITIYYGAAAAGLTALAAWKAFFLFWILPFFTIQALIHRLRSSTEHLALPKIHSLNSTRNIWSGSLERFFLGPHHSGLHLTHHMDPHVPWYRLTDVRKFYSANPVYRCFAHENTSYFLPSRRSVFAEITNEGSPLQWSQIRQDLDRCKEEKEISRPRPYGTGIQTPFPQGRAVGYSAGKSRPPGH